MHSERSREIKVGIVTLLAIILLVGGISVGKNLSVSVSDNMLIMKFPNSGGIQPSAPVVVNGVKLGTVSSVETLKDSVLIKAEMKTLNELRKDASARITILEITGGKKIEIHPGYSDDQLSKNDTIRGSTPPDIAELVALVGEVSGDAIKLLRRIDTVAASATDLFADGTVVDGIRASVDNSRELTGNINLLLKNNYTKLNATVDDLRFITSELKDAITDNRPALESIITKLDTTLSETRVLVNSAGRAVSSADSLIYDVRAVTNDVRSNEGLVNRLIYDKEFAQRLDSTLNVLNGFLYKINDHGVNVNLRLGTRP
ncbi:MAG: MlaD family protein [Candidatus Kapaibacterium sp.]